MRDCPKCSKPVDGMSCGYCGWGEQPHRGRASGVPPQRYMTPDERRANAEACRPIIADIKAMLRKREKEFQGHAIPHVLAGMATRGISYDPEAVAEREAIQKEGRLE